MKPFDFKRATDPESAVRAATSPASRYLAGGTNLLDLMKEGVEEPSTLIDINKLPLNLISTRTEGIRIGATGRNSDTANHPMVRSRFPLVAQAILSGASGQLRNVATNGGNLRQRTRCTYFYDVQRACNKRVPGSGCSAVGGVNRYHAIFGANAQCIATYPGDMAQALHALDASVQVLGRQGPRTIPIADFHRLPGENPELDSSLQDGDLITAIDLPTDAARFAPRSHYLKVRERASYAFALVSVAAALDVEGGRIREARLCLGGVAHMPWRAREAESMLKDGTPSIELFRAAAEVAVAVARPYEHNQYKVSLSRQAIVRSLQITSGISS